VRVVKHFSTLPISPSIVNGLCGSGSFLFLKRSGGRFGSAVRPVMNITRTPEPIF
jgi:hypothetical protein